jgi:hypothetical protein
MSVFAKGQGGVVERAFEIAREGRLANVKQILRVLQKEGYENTNQHLAGPTIARQLKAAIADACAGNAITPAARTEAEFRYHSWRVGHRAASLSAISYQRETKQK